MENCVKKQPGTRAFGLTWFGLILLPLRAFAQTNEEAAPVDVRERVIPVLEQLLDLANQFVVYLPLLGISLIIVLLFGWIGRFVSRRKRLFQHLSSNPFMRDLARQSVRIAILLVGVLIALEILDATALVGAVLGTAGVAGLALGFAFRDLVENYIASILLSLRQPFAQNDFVDIDGRSGKVVRLTGRATILMTADGNHLRIPNAQVFKGVILNYTRNPKRRFDFFVGIGVGEDLLEAQRIGVETLAAMNGVLDEPAPSSWIENLGDSSVQVRYLAWIDQTETSYVKAKGEAIRRVKTALEDAGMDLPEPIHRIQLTGTTAELMPATAQPPTPGSKSKSKASAEEVDVSADDPVDEQIRAERSSSATEKDLLDPNAPQE